MSLLMCLLVAYVLVRASEDTTSAIRKQPPPRQEIRTAKLNARANSSGNMPRSSVGRYVTGLIDDAWDSAHHRRQLMSDERGRRRQRRITRRIERRQAREQRRDEKRVRKQAAPERPHPVGFDTEGPTPVANTEQPAGTGAGGSTEVAGTTPQETTTSENTDAEPSHETPQEGTPAPSSDSASEGYSESAADTSTPEGFGNNSNGNVIQFPAAPAQSTNTPTGMELPTMSTEITGLNSAIQYANDLSTYCSHTNDQISSVLPSGGDATSSCEQARASLESGGVTGQSLADVTAVQEQMTAAVTALNDALSQLEAAGASAESLRQRLTSHLSVQESYAANPDAGTREFVTTD